MRAVRFTNPQGAVRIGALQDDTIRDAGPAGEQGFVPTEQAWAELGRADGPQYALGEVALLHPVVPDKILAIGLNYRSHAAESELDVPSVPVVFAKWTSSLIGPGAEIVIPWEETRPDFEGEVAVVIGRRTYRATEENARQAIGGISALHDVSGRRAQLETPLRQFTLGKSFDTFTPMGPAITSIDGVDLNDIEIRTTVSGEVMQDANTQRSDLRDRAADRVPVGRSDLESGRCDRDRHARRRRRFTQAASVSARRGHRRYRGRRRRHADQHRGQRTEGRLSLCYRLSVAPERAAAGRSSAASHQPDACASTIPPGGRYRPRSRS